MGNTIDQLGLYIYALAAKKTQEIIAWPWLTVGRRVWLSLKIPSMWNWMCSYAH
jgi:hypothetical protein